ncbi:MAG: sigma-70 family RNA polymerase sigma factor [Thermaerobacter sp.]|nr:sigma-70 family RNA polymerase sigma factor [Thermaerobacter sp.]
MANYGDRLVRFAFAHSGDWPLAQDVAQETFLRLYRWHQRHPHREITPAWCYQVAYHLLVDDHRRRTRERASNHQMVPDPAGGVDPAEGLGDRAAILGALESLSPGDRECLWLFYYEGWSTDQIAHALDRSPATVRTRLKRARDRFRSAFLRDAADHSQAGRT